MTRQTRLSSAQRTLSLSLTQNTYTKYELQLPHFWNIAIVLWSCLPQLERRITFSVKINAPSFSLSRLYQMHLRDFLYQHCKLFGYRCRRLGQSHWIFYSACALRKCLYLQVTTTHSQFSHSLHINEAFYQRVVAHYFSTQFHSRGLMFLVCTLVRLCSWYTKSSKWLRWNLHEGRGHQPWAPNFYSHDFSIQTFRRRVRPTKLTEWMIRPRDRILGHNEPEAMERWRCL